MMEPPIAALLGATVGGLAGLAGPLVGSSIQAVRDKAKWRLDNQRDAYVNALQHLASALNMPADASSADLSAELARAQAALGTVLIFCSESQRAGLTRTLEQLGASIDQPKGDAAIAKLYEAIVESARRDFHHK
jgi:hypothetical protein